MTDKQPVVIDTATEATEAVTHDRSVRFARTDFARDPKAKPTDRRIPVLEMTVEPGKRAATSDGTLYTAAQDGSIRRVGKMSKKERVMMKRTRREVKTDRAKGTPP